ncbi:hypothetical protein HYX13_04100 [Candidatus Woesearchaeota archaeon]|nr:hypothetical protein [Candidatus Woesearchaeota archaeon]
MVAKEMIPSRSEIFRSLELYILQKDLQTEAERKKHHLALTFQSSDHRSIKHIVVASGSYDPLTLAHETIFTAAKEAVQQKNYKDAPEDASVLVVSSTAHYDKRIDLQKNSTVPDRMLALETLYAPRAKSFVGMFNDPYFVNLAPQVQKMFPQANLGFVMGTDVLEQIANEEEQRRRGFDPKQVFDILFQHEFLVSARTYLFRGEKKFVTRDLLLEACPHLQMYEKNIQPFAVPEKISTSDLLVADMSSTLAREKVNKSESLNGVVHSSVEAFISRWKLYQQNEPTNSWYEKSVHLRNQHADSFGKESFNRVNFYSLAVDSLMDDLERL